MDVNINFPSWETTCLLLGDKNMLEISNEQLDKQLIEGGLIPYEEGKLCSSFIYY